MSDPVIKVQNLGKLYRLGEVGTGSIADDLKRWWANVRGREDPFSTVGTVNDRTSKDGQSDYVWALKDINFEVKKGEVLGIIGRNGAGKSTLLKLLSRITAPSTGSISIRGRVASLLEVGTGFNPELTGKENVYLNGTILGMTKREVDSRYEEIMEFAGCTRYADTPVKRYSSGMKVRLGFAVAAFLEPEILIVDEVLAVGDAEFQRKAIGKIKDVTEKGSRTVLFVSHNMDSIQKICGRVIILKNGNIIENSSDVDFSIASYLSDGKMVGEPYWNNNSTLKYDYDISPIEIYLSNSLDEKILAPLRNNEEYFLAVKIDVKDVNLNVRLNLMFYSDDERLLFITSCYDTKDENWPTFRQGINLIKVPIPKRLLNEGKYTVEFTIKDRITGWLISPREKNTPRITFEINGGLSDSYLYTRKRKGILAPILKWEIENNA